MSAKVANSGVLSPESTQALEEALGLEAGKYGFKTSANYDGAARAWNLSLVIKQKGSREMKVIHLGTL